MKDHFIDLTLLALTLYLLCCIPALLSEYSDATFKSSTEQPFLDHGVKL